MPAKHSRARWAVRVAIAAVLAVGSSPASAAPPRGQPTRNQLEAALLLTISRFVEWSPQSFASPSAPLVIAVVSDEGMAAAVEVATDGRLVGGRSVTLRRLRWDSDMAGVHLLVVGEAEGRRVSVLLERLRGTPVLTVSRLPGFAAAGGMLTLLPLEGRVGFTINESAAAGSGLRLSSSLRAHATRPPVARRRLGR